MQYKMIPGWGLLISIFVALMAGAGDAGDSTFAVIGIALLVFGVWGGILLVKDSPSKRGRKKL